MKGGAMHDALVGAASRVTGCRLLTRDLRDHKPQVADATHQPIWSEH